MNWIINIFTSILLFFGIGSVAPDQAPLAESAEYVIETIQTDIFEVPQEETVGVPAQKNSTSKENVVTANFWIDYIKPSNEILKNNLSSLAYSVTQEEGTERAGTSVLTNNHEAGIYVDILSGQPLFSSRDKFDSGTGWPSFVRPITPSAVTEHTDNTLATARTEIRSSIADNHLGHVFTDGPRDSTGLRYCINGVALKFIPLSQMSEKGYGNYISYVE